MRHSPCVLWLSALPILFLSIIVSAQQIPAATEEAAARTLTGVRSAPVPVEVQVQIERLREGDAADAAMRLQILGARAKAAIPALMEALQHEDPVVRLWAVRALGEMAPESKAALESLLKLEREDLDPGVRLFAAKAGKKVFNTPDGEPAVTAAEPAVPVTVPPVPVQQADRAAGQAVRPADTQSQVRTQPPGARTHAMAARLSGTWQGGFTFEGSSYTETLTLSADGRASSQVVDHSDNAQWSVKGRFQYASGRLKFSFVGEEPYEQFLSWVDSNRFRLSDGEITVEYARVGE